MIADKYITVQELRDIANLCKQLDGLQETLKRITSVAVSLLDDEEGLSRTFEVWDSNGETLGHIGYGDSGYALYLDNGEETNDNTGDSVEGVDYATIDDRSKATIPAGEGCPECGMDSNGYHIPFVSMGCVSSRL